MMRSLQLEKYYFSEKLVAVAIVYKDLTENSTRF